jgi:light-regulated signal transduction histidine kinase (bacteriophytochrome)
MITPITTTTTGKNYDSEFCGSIPTHLINLIQPHGALLVLEKNSLTIVQGSENTEQILGIPVAELLNQPLETYVEAPQVEAIREKTTRFTIKDKIPVDIQFNAGNRPVALTASIHMRDAYVLLEFEEIKQDERQQSFLSVYQEIKYIMAALKEAASVEEIGRIVIPEIRRLSGFDRVMLYRFDAQWNGTVVAEAREEHLDPYLHLWFPASDVPKQTRDLYFKNPYRLIPNRDYTPVKLIPVINPLVRTFTDLSECALRGVPGVHVEYLKNMDVAASMSTPIIVHNQLWGLISCHHQTPRYPNYEMRSAFELLSNVIAAQLAYKERELLLQDKSELDRIGARLVERLYTQKDFVTGMIDSSPNIADLLRAQGAVIIYDGVYKTVGKTPQLSQIKEIVRWLQLNQVDKVFATNHFTESFNLSAAFPEVASGLIALPIAPRKGEYVLGFRPEVIQTVEWGGNPNQAINFEADGKTYHPRNSFAIWKENVRNTSLPWKSQEMEAADHFRISFLERILAEKS